MQSTETNANQLQDLRRWAIRASLALAFLAQYLFTGELFTHFQDSNTWVWEPQFTAGAVLLVLAGVLAAWALWPPAFVSSDAQVPDMPSQPAGAWPGLALLCYLVMMGVYFLAGETLMVDVLWLAAALILIVPLARRLPRTSPTSASLLEWLGIAAVATAGFVLRYWHLTEIPSHVDNDVAEVGMSALQLINSGNYGWIGSTSIFHLLSYIQYHAWSMRLFGQDQYGIVMSSVITGTLTLPLIYWLGREFFNWRVGLLAMVLLTFDYTHIQFSRILFGATATFLIVLAVYLIFLGLRRQQAWLFAMAGVVTGIGPLLYDSGRILPVLVCVYVLWQALFQRQDFRRNMRNWMLLALGAVIGFGPTLGFALKDFNSFAGRGNVVAIWNQDVLAHEMDAYQVNNFAEVILQQTLHSFLTFHLYGDGSPHFSFPRPMVAPLTAALLVVGAGFLILRLRTGPAFMLSVWMVLTLVLGGVLTYDPPYWPHLNILLPAVMLTAAVAADEIVSLFEPVSGRYGLALLWGGVAVLVGLTAYFNWQAYYGYVENNADPRIRIARYIHDLPPGYTAYLVSSATSWNEYAFQFFDRGVPGSSISADELAARPPILDRPLVFILMDHEELADRLKTVYLDAVVSEQLNNEGSRVFVAVVAAPGGHFPQASAEVFNPLLLPGWWLIAAGLVMAVAGKFGAYPALLKG